MHALTGPAAAAELAGAAALDTGAAAELAGAAALDAGAAAAEVAGAGAEVAAAGALVVGALVVFLLLEQPASMIATVPVAAMIR
jgi:hypothetical protein